ncbi:helix-turn-helix domain-containing protein [Pseudarthrobacter siccitolerans]|uniref:helix-turn-helix domain-containing protein n=1 Tax=Pseudarthrobacter siccitolerans TaxID=861266 RepID=UPI000B331510|nr:helix-turn-helix domain-containing protein [Pseudarthrobacter siccitolerans]
MPATPAPCTTTHCEDDELTVPEAARRLKRHPQTVREYIHAGMLPAHRVGTGKRSEFRVYASDLALVVHPVEPTGAAVPAPDDPSALADLLVSSWPTLSDERRRELGQLISAS